MNHEKDFNIKAEWHFKGGATENSTQKRWC